LPFFEANPNKVPIFEGLIEFICGLMGHLTFYVHACCDLNILGEDLEILSVHNTQIFRYFHLASPPIIEGLTADGAKFEGHTNAFAIHS